LGETKNKRIREMMTGPSVSPSFSLLTSSIFLVDCLYNARLCALCIFVLKNYSLLKLKSHFRFGTVPESPAAASQAGSRTVSYKAIPVSNTIVVRD
jgi:hypothetical protein